MKTRFVVSLLGALFAYPSSAFAADDFASAAQKLLEQSGDVSQLSKAIAVPAPEEFIISRDPPGMQSARPFERDVVRDERSQNTEKGQAVNGTLYTVIAPIYLGGGPDGGNTSFVRFYNRNTFSTTFTVAIVGYRTDSTVDSGSTILGTAVVTVPSTASPQYSIEDIFDAAGIDTVACPSTCPANVYQGVALYVRSPSTDVGYQHVIFNRNSLFFENATICGDTSLSDGLANPYVAFAVDAHTSIIGNLGYPGSIVFHNYASTNTEYTFYLTDANTGAVMGRVITTLLANTTYVLPVSWFETQSGRTPSATQGHVNILAFKVVNGSVAKVNAVMGNLIYNQGLQAYINMSQVCYVSH
jgi:hypothetical protein